MGLLKAIRTLETTQVLSYGNHHIIPIPILILSYSNLIQKYLLFIESVKSSLGAKKS